MEAPPPAPPDLPLRPTPARPAGWRVRLDDAVVVAAARVGVTPRAVLGLAVVALLVVSVLGLRTLLARDADRPLPLAPAATAGPADGRATTSATTSAAGMVVGPEATGATGSGPSGASTAGASTVGPATPVSPQFLVHVVGRVAHPGVVRVAPGSRVQDVLAAAGGATGGADVSVINLARPVVDGEQVVVPRRGQAVTSTAPGGGAGGGASGGAGGGAGGVPGGGPAGTVLDLNSASATDLEALPGVGPVLAERIVAWRTAHGRFSTVDELSEVSGIGDRVLERLRPQVRV